MCDLIAICSLERNTAGLEEKHSSVVAFLQIWLHHPYNTCNCQVLYNALRACNARNSGDANSWISDCGASFIPVLHQCSYLSRTAPSWEYHERLCVAYLCFSYHEKVPRGWAHLRWILGAAHRANRVSFVSVLSCLRSLRRLSYSVTLQHHVCE